MIGIAGVILNRLKSVLLQCGPFSREGALNAVFVDARLAPWRDSVPRADDPQEQVNLIIECLYDQESADGENALVLFVRVLSEQKDPGDACHQRLVQLAHDLVGRGADAEIPVDFVEPVAEFVNREDELQRLNVERLRASRSPYTLINAPAGYGKSHLLKRLAQGIQTDEMLCQRWRFRYMDLQRIAEGAASRSSRSGDLRRTKEVDLRRIEEVDLRRTKEGDLQRIEEGDLLRTKEGDLLRTEEGDLLRTEEGDLLHTEEADLLQTGAEDLLRAGEGDIRRAVDGQIMGIIGALMKGQVPDLSSDLDASVACACDYILHELTLPSPDGERAAVLLIFDAVERLDAETQQWLYDLLNVLRQRIQPGYREIFTVRIIVAGRNVEVFWEGYQRVHPMPPAPQRINLSAFDLYAIQDMIWRRATAAQIPLDDQTVIQIATEVAYLSGGHPKVICGLMDDLAEKVFAIGPPVGYFAQNRERLVRRYLTPVADELLHSVAAPLRDAVKALSVFRRVSGNTVEALVAADVLPSETDAVDLLRDLIEAQLLKAQSVREPFYRDHLIRRVLSLDAAYRSLESRARYEQLNALALGLYARWIGEGLQDPHLGPTQRLLSVVEWLFHALQDETMSEQQLCTTLQGHLEALTVPSAASTVGASGPSARASDVSTVRPLIMKEIKEDAELCYLLDHRLGADGIAILDRWLGGI